MQRDEYHRLAQVEDTLWYFRALHGHVDRALGAFSRTETVRVLDAGCGTGGLMRRLQGTRPGWPWVGVDAEAEAVDLARVRVAPGTRIQLARLEALPFADGEFDVVTCLDVLYHIERDDAALREIGRVLRPGGRLLVNVPVYRWLWSYHDVAVHAVRRYTRSELLEKLRAAGLTVETWTHWNALPLPLLIARRKLWRRPPNGSDVQPVAGWINTSLDTAMALERCWLRTGARIRFGSSLFAVARKTA